MKRQVLFLQGGGAGAYEADGKLAASLQQALGDDYELRYPRMPEEASPAYAAWSGQIAQELATVRDSVILVGHSLGGSILLKYLSEADVAASIAGIFLIAAPYWGAEDWQVDEFTLREGFASRLPSEPPVFLYHGRDDEIVPFAHLALYAKTFGRATVREFDGRGHQFNNDLSVVAADIVTR